MRFILLLCLAFVPFSTIYAQPVEAPIAAPEKPALDIQIVTSKKGIKAWLVEDHSIPVLAMNFGFAGAGTVQDPQGLQGLARLMSNTMDEGAGDLDAQSFQTALRDHSISLSYGANRDHFTGNLKTLSRYQDKAFELLAVSLTKPRFDQDAVTRMISANQSRIKASLARPEWVAARIMNDVAFGDHPYAQNSGGTVRSLATITPLDLARYHANALGLDNLYIAVAGAITPEELSGALDDIFGALPKQAALQTIDDATLLHGGKIALYEKDIPQTIIQITQPGIDRHDPQYHVAKVMNFILGSSGFGSRLTRVIREERGLTYGIYTGFSHLNHSNTLSLHTSTKNESAAEMMDLIRQEWTRMASEPVSADELADAQSYLIGSLPLSLTSTDQIAGVALGLQLDGLPVDYLTQRTDAIKAVSIDDLTALSKKLLQLDSLSIVMVGNPQNIDADRIIEEIPNAE